MKTYTLLLYRETLEPRTWYGVVPAVRGVLSDGDSLEEAVQMTTDALEGMLEAMLEQGESLPSDAFDLETAKRWAEELFAGSALEFLTRQAKVKIGVNAIAA